MIDHKISPIISRIHDFWGRLTEPKAIFDDPIKRHQARFLLGVLWLLAPLGLVFGLAIVITTNSSLETQLWNVLLVIMTALGGVLIYQITSRWYQRTIWLFITLASGVIFLATIITNGAPTFEIFSYLIIPMLLGSVLLSTQKLIRLIIIHIVIMLAMFVVAHSLYPDLIDDFDFLRPFGLYVITAPLTTMVVSYFAGVEALRTQTLATEIQERIHVEETLARQANLLQQVSNAIISTDGQLRIQTWNRAAEIMYGWRADEVIGHELAEIVFNDYEPEEVSVITESILRMGYWKGELTQRTRDDEVLDVLCSASTIRERQRNITSVVFLGQDITARKEAERAETQQRLLAEALREAGAAITSTLSLSEVLQRILAEVRRVIAFDTASIMLIEDDQARVMYAQGFAEQGVDPESILRLRLSLTRQPNLRHAIDSLAPVLVADTHNSQNWMHIPNVSWDIRCNITAPIELDGRAIGLLTIDHAQPNAFNEADAHAIEAFANQAAIAIRNAQLFDEVRKHAEELDRRVQERTTQMAQERAQFQAILDSIHEGVIGQIKLNDKWSNYMNPAMKQLFQFEGDVFNSDLLTPANYTPEEYAARRMEIAQFIQANGLWESDGHFILPNGDEIDAHITANAIYDQHKQYIGMVSVFRDISQEKALAERQSRFVANASHELRTPLTNLITRLYLFRRQPERFFEHLDILESVAARMRRLVEDLLDHSRFERGVIPLEPNKVDLAILVEQVAQSQQAEAELKNIILTYHLPDRPLEAWVDEARLVQVLTNLVINAINFTPMDGRISIELDSSEQGGRDDAIIRVRDTGIGIPSDMREEIFKPFFRANENSKGTGLGLSIAKEIVNLHGGTIEVENNGDGGTCFVVRLPLKV